MEYILTKHNQIQDNVGTNMRIVCLGSGGTILDLDWFLNYRGAKLAIHASQIEGKNDLLACIKAISGFGQPQH